MSANLISDELDEAIVNGHIQYTYTQHWEVTANSATTGPVSVKNDADLPAIGSEVEVEGVKMWWLRKTPSRRDVRNSQRHWSITCVASNQTQTFERQQNGAPAQTPEQIAKQIDFTLNRVQIPQNKATFLGIERMPSGTAVTPAAYWAGVVGKPGPIVNSALVPQLKETTRANRIFTVYVYKRNWDNNWENYIDSINSAAITISESDEDGVRFSKSFPAKTLRLDDITKENHWREGRLYYRAGFVMSENKNTWVHRELDKGTQRLINLGHSKPISTTNPDDNKFWSSDDVKRGRYQSITTNDGTAIITDPIKFNGDGQEIPTKANPGTYDPNNEWFELLFDEYEAKAWAGALPL